MVNELNFSLAKSFEEIEKSHELAFSIVFLEKIDLESQDVNKIKEEELFNDYIRVNESINSINLQLPSEKDFSGQYFFYSKKFADFTKTAGFDEQIVKETSIFDVIDFFDDKLVSFIPKDKFTMPIILPSYFKLFEFVKSAFEVNQSVSVLESMPSFEFFDFFNNFVGTKNSSAKKFVELINSDNFHRKMLSTKIIALENELKEKLIAVEEQVFLIDDSFYSSFDQNFLSELASLTEFSSTISSNEFSVKELSTLKSESIVELAELKASFNDLKSMPISFGKKLNSLKELTTKTKLLGDSIEFYSGNAIEGLKNVCTNRIDVVKNKLKEVKPSLGEQPLNLIANLEFKIKEFEDSSDTVSSLTLCKQIVEDYKEFESLAQDNELELAADKEFDECFSDLKNFFKNPSSDFFDLTEIFENLSFQEKLGNANTGDCVNLHEKTINVFNSLDDSQEILSNYIQTKNYLLQLKKISLIEKSIESSFESLSKKNSLQKDFFEQEKLKLKAFLVLDELKTNSFSLLVDVKNALSLAIKTHLENNLLIEVYSDDKVKADSFNYSKTKITAKNLIEAFDVPVSFSVNVILEKPLEVFKTPNVQGFLVKDKEIVVDLNFVPLGSSVLVLEDARVPANTSEKIIPISVSLSRAFFEKQIKIQSNADFGLLEVSTDLPLNTDLPDLHVFFEGKSISFEKDFNGISFTLENVSSNDVVSVFFSIRDPLEVNVEKTEVMPVDSNSFNYLFLIKASNLLDFELKNIKILVPISLKEKNFEVTKSAFADGEKLLVEEFSFEKFFLTFKEFKPREKKDALIEFKVKNYSGFWSSVVEDIENKISGLLFSSNKKISDKASGFSKELLELKVQLDFVNDVKIKELVDLSFEVQKLFEENNSFEETISANVLLKQEILEKILFLEENAKKLDGLGFKGDAQKIFSKTKKAINSLNGAQIDSLSGFESLLSIKSSLSDLDGLNVKDLLLFDVNKTVSEANSLIGKEKNLGLVFSGKDVFFEADKSVSFYLSENNFVKAKEFVDKLKGSLVTLSEEALSKSQKILEEKQSGFSRLKDLLDEIPLNAEKLKSLEKGFLEKLENRFFPTSSDRIDRLLLKFDSLAKNSFFEKIEQINLLQENSQTIDAAVLSLSLEKESQKFFSEAKKISLEFSKDLAQIKEDAFNSYYLAELKSRNSSNAEIQELLLQSKQKIESDDFVQGILFAEKASELIDKNTGLPLNIPLVIYPVILLAITGLFFKYRQKKIPAPQKVKVERVKFS